jgi:hypothetical protein
VAIATFEWFGKAFANEHGGEVAGDSFAVDFLSDTIKIALATSSYAPNLDSHEVFSDVTNEIAGTGYSAGGLALGSKTLTFTAADSWATARANTTGYVVGDVIRPSTPNGFLYRCVVAGTSAGSPPAFSTTIGRETADGSVVWTTLGKSIVVWDAADPSWAAASFTARKGIIYKDTGTPSTSPLLWLVTFDADVTSSGGTFLITLPSQLPGWAYKARA